jgi:DNA-binding NtrC family response regulator
MEDVTRTGGDDKLTSDGELRVLKLRVLFTGQGGIEPDTVVCWSGPGALSIGRRGALPLEDAMVSREHAELAAAAGPGGAIASLRDLGSKNGTAVNGVRLRPGEARPIADGDVIRVGDSLLVARSEGLRPADAAVPQLVGVSAAMAGIRDALARWAKTASPVLLLGETGTGKGAAAEALHALSGRRGRLVSVNCAAIPATLAEGMLFGTRRGAFTGAAEQPGFFGEAHGGTLFLDEVGELPRELQPKLLHSLERREVTPLGSSQPVQWDVRFVAATHRDLAAAVKEGGFRQDLLARLSGAVVELPPLRGRKEDVLLLVRHLVQGAGGSFRPSARLAEALCLHDWPSNVREVGNVVSRLLTLGEAEVLRALEAQRVREARGPAAEVGRAAPVPIKAGAPAPTREELIALLERTGGSLRRIEIEAGYSRRQLGRWAKQHGIDVDAFRARRGRGTH